MKLISVIVPIYKVEKFLSRCVDSLLAQTYKNIEIILVDDGSPDACPSICDQYAVSDKRVRVIHKENGGLSDARNAGLAIARGDFISFVDSDDWVSPFFIEFLVNTLEKENADIAECGKIITDGTSQPSHTMSEISNQVFDAEDALKALIEDRILQQVVWNKIYTREVIDGIRFAKGKYNEDEFFTYQVFGKASRVVKTDAELYFYYQRPESIMGSSYSLKRLDGIEAKCLRQDYIKKNFPELEGIAGTNLIASIIYVGQMSLKYLSTKERIEAINRLKEYLDIYCRQPSYSFVGEKKHVIWYHLACINLSLTCRLRNKLRMNVN